MSALSGPANATLGNSLTNTLYAYQTAAVGSDGVPSGPEIVEALSKVRGPIAAKTEEEAEETMKYGQAIPTTMRDPRAFSYVPATSAPVQYPGYAKDYMASMGGDIFGTPADDPTNCAGLCESTKEDLEPYVVEARGDECIMDFSTGRVRGSCTYVADATVVDPKRTALRRSDDPFVDMSSSCYKMAVGTGFGGVCPDKLSNSM